MFPSGEGRGEFPWEDEHVVCCGRAALAENSFLPPKPLPVALGKTQVLVSTNGVFRPRWPLVLEG